MADHLIPLFGSDDQAYKHKTQSYDPVVMEPLKNDDLGMIERSLHHHLNALLIHLNEV